MAIIVAAETDGVACDIVCKNIEQSAPLHLRSSGIKRWRGLMMVKTTKCRAYFNLSHILLVQ
jgi:hypothetical protein